MVLNDNYIERIKIAIQTTYEAIASDLGEVNLEQAVELTLDADRISMYGGDDEALAEFNKLSFKQKKLIAFVALKVYF